MATKDLSQVVKSNISLAPAARAASANGSSVDMSGYESALILIALGSWTDGIHAYEVQESDDDAAWTAVAAADLVGTEPTVSDATDDDSTVEIGYIGSKRYVRVVVTCSGSPLATGTVSSAVIVQGHARHAPV